MNRKFTSEHEWIEPAAQPGCFRVGITDYAQSQLGDVVVVELPALGRQFAAGAECAVIESVKAASDIYAPIGGTIRAINERLADAPELLNEDAEGEGWLFEIEGSPDDMAGLMDRQEYDRHIA